MVGAGLAGEVAAPGNCTPNLTHLVTALPPARTVSTLFSRFSRFHVFLGMPSRTFWSSPLMMLDNAGVSGSVSLLRSVSHVCGLAARPARLIDANDDRRQHKNCNTVQGEHEGMAHLGGFSRTLRRHRGDHGQCVCRRPFASMWHVKAGNGRISTLVQWSGSMPCNYICL